MISHNKLNSIAGQMLLSALVIIPIAVFNDISNIEHMMVSCMVYGITYIVFRSHMLSLVLTLTIGVSKELYDPVFDYSDLVFDIVGIVISAVVMKFMRGNVA